MGIEAKKELGQNFLTDQTSILKMVNALQAPVKTTIIEIGPGLGVVTKQLIETYPNSNIVAIEFDKRLINSLKAQFESENVKIVDGNILDWLPAYHSTDTYSIIGSLPYYITSPILHAVIYKAVKPQTCVFLVQKEVAQKIASKLDDASYLSTFIKSFYDVEYLGVIPRTLFNPVPQVDGGVLKLTLHADQQISFDQTKRYEGFLHRVFSHPRKMLNKVFTPEELKLANINGSLRPQNLTPADYVRIFRELKFQ